MFERFHADARTAVVLAQEEARGMGHNWTGTEHLLLGLAAQHATPATEALHSTGVEISELRGRVARLDHHGQPLDADALATLGIDLDEVRRAAEEAFGPGALNRQARGKRGRAHGHIPFTPRAKKALEHGLKAAVRRGHNYIGAGHVLLGVVEDEDGAAARVLRAAGTDLVELRAEVDRRIDAEAA